jgi:2-keto-3-deoxy-L-fuconate dehydrogenase
LLWSCANLTGKVEVKRLKGKRTVTTQIDALMGKDLITLFQSEGGAVVVSDSRIHDAIEALIREAGHVGVSAATLAAAQPRTLVLDTDGGTFGDARSKRPPFASLGESCASTDDRAPSRQDRLDRHASRLTDMPNYSAYGSARGAQPACVQDAGTKVGRYKLQVNRSKEGRP